MKSKIQILHSSTSRNGHRPPFVPGLRHASRNTHHPKSLLFSEPNPTTHLICESIRCTRLRGGRGVVTVVIRPPRFSASALGHLIFQGIRSRKQLKDLLPRICIFCWGVTLAFCIYSSRLLGGRRIQGSRCTLTTV